MTRTIACAALLVLVACGGGNGGESDTSTEADVVQDTTLDTSPDPGDTVEDPSIDPVDEDAGDAVDDTGEDASAFCPDIPGAVVFRMAEAFVPSPTEPVREFLIPCAGGLTYGSIVVEMDLTHGGWFATAPDGTHGIFQLQRDSRWRSNLYGYMTMFGPPQNEVKVISNIDLGAGEVVRLNRRPIVIPEFETYHIRYTYDTTIPERRLLITSGGDTVLDISDAQTVENISTLAPGFELFLATEDAGSAGPEVPTYGWTYENVCVQILP